MKLEQIRARWNVTADVKEGPDSGRMEGLDVDEPKTICQ